MRRLSDRRSLCTFVLAALLFALPAQGENSPQWRGPEGQGHSAATGLALTWGEGKNMAWKTPLPGRGWSSPVIEGDQIWMTYAIEVAASEEQAKERLKANTGNQPLTVLAKAELHAICVSRSTGKILFDIEVLTEQDPQWVHRLNSYASPTPIIDAGRVYCHFGTYGTACVDADTGDILWRNREHHVMHENGPGSTAVLHGNRLIFHCDGSDVQYVAALDASTGKTAWKTDRSGKMNDNPQLKKAYGTPLVIEIGGKAQVMSPGADWMYSYDPQTGKELWKVHYGVLGFSTVPRPVAGHGMVYMCTSFMRSELLAIRVDGKGETKEPHVAWRFTRGAPQMPSPLLVGDEIYIVGDQGGLLTCLDAKTGDVHYRERLDGNYSSSPMYADGKIFIASREGITHVLAPGKAFKVLASNKVDGAIFATPAAVDGAIYLRTDKALYRIEKN
ncbi:MAG: PQQ-binding-like beta-propeller repeat protein [Phycisphaeraceae bacterium]